MSKVVLTKEQAEAIEKWLQPNKVGYAKKDLLKQHSQICLLNSLSWTDTFKGLRTMSIDEMAKALYVGYEIEQPKFEVGELVVGLKSGNMFEITGAIGENFYGTRLKDGMRNLLLDRDMIRHATKEEIFWLELSREVGEFVEGDMGEDFNGHLYKSVNTINTIYRKNQLKGFYPANSYIKFPE